jgi:aquaporin related protein
MFLTAQLVFTIFMLATEKHEGTFIAPVGIGLSLFTAELMGVFYTGGSVNPARSFGPCVVTHTFASYHWIYWVGPILGSLLASAFYMFVKALEYETVNLVVDPKAVMGEKFNIANKAEDVTAPRRESRLEANERPYTGTTAGTYAQAPILESGPTPVA